MLSVHWSVRTWATAVACGLGLAGAVVVSAGAVAVAPPVLVLEPAEGPPGATVTARASGFEACEASPDDNVDVAADPSGVVFTWDGERFAGPVTVVDGTAAAPLTIPKAASPGAHTVTAACAGAARPASSAEFTVTETKRWALALDPTEGPSGTAVRVTVTEAAGCPPAGQDDVGPGEVVFLWDDEQVAGPVQLDQKAASATFAIPRSAPAGTHRVVARCVGDPELDVAEDFTVTAAATTGSGDPGGGHTPPATDGPLTSRAGVGPVWPAVALLVLLLAGLLAAWIVRVRRGLRWVRLHVRVAAGPAPLDVAAPVESSPPSVAVRVSPRPDRGTQILQEVRR